MVLSVQWVSFVVIRFCLIWLLFQHVPESLVNYQKWVPLPHPVRQAPTQILLNPLFSCRIGLSNLSSRKTSTKSLRRSKQTLHQNLEKKKKKQENLGKIMENPSNWGMLKNPKTQNSPRKKHIKDHTQVQRAKSLPSPVVSEALPLRWRKPSRHLRCEPEAM